jgi:predicted Ser/Thr protein kinase
VLKRLRAARSGDELNIEVSSHKFGKVVIERCLAVQSNRLFLVSLPKGKQVVAKLYARGDTDLKRQRARENLTEIEKRSLRAGIHIAPKPEGELKIEGVDLLLMEYVEGQDFGGCMQQKTLDWDAFAKATLELIEHCVRLGIRHDDLVGMNIMLRPDATACLVDLEDADLVAPIDPKTQPQEFFWARQSMARQLYRPIDSYQQGRTPDISSTAFYQQYIKGFPPEDSMAWLLKKFDDLTPLKQVAFYYFYARF